MEEFILTVQDSDTKIPFKLTYGIQKELQAYLMQENNFYELFNDPDKAEYVYKICLSKRNDQGQIIEEFTAFETLDIIELNILLETLFDYFENFFLSRQKRLSLAAKKLQDQSSTQ